MQMQYRNKTPDRKSPQHAVLGFDTNNFAVTEEARIHEL